MVKDTGAGSSDDRLERISDGVPNVVVTVDELSQDVAAQRIDLVAPQARLVLGVPATRVNHDLLEAP